MVFKILEEDKNLKDQQRNTHIITNKITNKKVICGFFAVEEKSHERETEKKDEQQMRKVEKIEDDDEFSV